MAAFHAWVRDEFGIALAGYDDLWAWSTSDVDDFWRSIWDYFEVGDRHGQGVVLEGARMPHVSWFPGCRVNYAERLLSQDQSGSAIIEVHESGHCSELTWTDLRDQVARAAGGLRRMGVGQGARVCAVAPNTKNPVVAMLAAASIGAVWSSVAPEYGVTAILDRFSQLAPTVLFACAGYTYGGRDFDTVAKVEELTASLPTLRHVVDVEVPSYTKALPRAVPWKEFLSTDAELAFAAVEFSDPLWVLFSSGTTGAPKALVQGHGGIVLEHLKALSLHFDVGGRDRLMWYTTPTWMMWNYQVSAMLRGATVVLYDGSPSCPSPDAFWRAAGRHRVTLVGTSPGYIQATRMDSPNGFGFDLSSVRTVGTTGSALSGTDHAWLHEMLPGDVHVAPVSGGTDICSGFVGPNPTLAEYAGEMQCRMLGAAVACLDDEGNELVGSAGELVIQKPMPSMPLYIYGDDEDRSRYLRAYFDRYPGVWRHGDWLELTERGTAIIYGRSDATLNRGGVRMGSGEFYEVVENLPFVSDSLVVDVQQADAPASQLLLFVVLSDAAPSDSLDQVRKAIRTHLSPRHAVDEIFIAPSVPRTATGKKCEVPVKRILQGETLGARQTAGVADTDTLSFYIDLAGRPDRGASRA